MTKNLKQNLLGMALAAGCLGTAVSAHAVNPQRIWANTAAWGAWSPIQQADEPVSGNMVRGQVSRRHARDRVFYNTTSNRGPYDRALHVECTNQWAQDNFNIFFRFNSDSDADLTLFCDPGNELVNQGGTSSALITSQPF